MTDAAKPGRVQRWLSRQGPLMFSSWTIVAAFCTYFCMYAFRRPFTAGMYAETTLGNMDYKTVLIISQVLGYTISKFIGVKVVSEIGPRRRGVAILGLIGAAELALLAFAIVPPPWNFVFLFLNGLPLGMVFGLVLAFLEGRRVTEALTAGLCASFIFSSGVVKSVGRILVLNLHVSEYWMPVLTGLIFVPPLLVSVWMLRQIPPPNPEDIAARSERVPMNREARWAFFRKYAGGLSLLVVVYVALTVIRSIRDDFAVEIWRDLGENGKPEVFAQSELLVMLSVISLNAGAIWIKQNRTAFFAALLIIGAGFGLTVLGAVMQATGQLGPFSFMVISGIALYIPYVAFHTTVFERFIAATREPGNLGFLMYVADSTGYLGYVGVLAVRTFRPERENVLDFFLTTSLLIAAMSLFAIVLAGWYFARRLPQPAVEPAWEGG